MQIDSFDDDCFDQVICGSEITCNYDNDKKTLYKKALREMQQKRLMNSTLIKNLKKKCRQPNNMYCCPICKKKDHDQLQASHIGEPIMKKIDYIIDTYIDSLDFYELYKKVITEEDNSLIIIACRKCNKELED